MIAATIRGITVTENEFEGICVLIQDALDYADIPDVNACDAVSDCLADGFEHYSGDQNYPIAHPTMRAVNAFDECDLWDTRSPYGRNRHAAWAFIQARADRFTIVDNELEYTPR